MMKKATIMEVIHPVRLDTLHQDKLIITRVTAKYNIIVMVESRVAVTKDLPVLTQKKVDGDPVKRKS